MLKGGDTQICPYSFWGTFYRLVNFSLWHLISKKMKNSIIFWYIIHRTSCYFIICVYYFSKICCPLRRATLLFFEKSVFLLKKHSFQEKIKWERKFTFSPPVLFCAILGWYSVYKPDKRFCFYVSLVTSSLSDWFCIFCNILHQFFCVCIFRAIKFFYKCKLPFSCLPCIRTDYFSSASSRFHLQFCYKNLTLSWQQKFLALQIRLSFHGDLQVLTHI